jgi:hypothetical protein
MTAVRHHQASAAAQAEAAAWARWDLQRAILREVAFWVALSVITLVLVFADANKGVELAFVLLALTDHRNHVAEAQVRRPDRLS